MMFKILWKLCSYKQFCVEDKGHFQVNRWTESIMQNSSYETEALLPFSSPTSILVSGATQSGKTFFTKRLLSCADKMFTIPPSSIIYAYTEYQPMFDEMIDSIPKLRFHCGLPSREEIEQYSEGNGHTILVLDDMFLKIGRSEDCVHLFTVTSHHRNISVIYLTQSLYPPGKYSRTISLNCLNVILFKNFRDTRQIISFGSQILPGNLPFFKSAYESATRVNYGYIHICLEPNQVREYQLRTNIFPGEEIIVYQPL